MLGPDQLVFEKDLSLTPGSALSRSLSISFALSVAVSVPFSLTHTPGAGDEDLSLQPSEVDRIEAGECAISSGSTFENECAARGNGPKTIVDLIRLAGLAAPVN